MAETVTLLKLIEQTGVSAVTIHARHVPDRPRDPANWDKFTEVVRNASLSVPVILNGDIWEREDIETARKKTGFTFYF